MPVHVRLGCPAERDFYPHHLLWQSLKPLYLIKTELITPHLPARHSLTTTGGLAKAGH